MSETHLCITCSRAKWKRTKAGNLHPDGQGKCGWVQPHIPTPEAWRWGWGTNGRQPVADGGHIDRSKNARPVVECETYDWNGLRRPT